MGDRITASPAVTGTLEKNKTTQTNILVEVMGDFNQLEPMRTEWDKFVESIGGEIFLTYDWSRVWWRYYGAGRQLQIFIFRQDGALVGIIPMFFEKIWLGPVFIRAAKIVGSDFTISTFTPPIKAEFIREVIQSFLAKLAAEYRWDVLHIGPISGIFGDCDELFSLCREYAGAEYRVSKINNTVQTYFILSGSESESADNLSKKQKR